MTDVKERDLQEVRSRFAMSDVAWHLFKAAMGAAYDAGHDAAEEGLVAFVDKWAGDKKEAERG